MLFTKTLTLFLFNIFLIISNILAQQLSVQITGQITGTNGPNRGINGIPLELSGDAFTSTVHDTTAGDGNYSVNMIIDAIQDNTFVPLKSDMGNYPNPFNPHTTVYFELPKAEDVLLEIFDVRGRKVRTLANDHMRAGRHEIQWDAMNEDGMSVAEGTYLYRLLTKSGHMQSGKMTYMHDYASPGGTQQSAFSPNIQPGNHGTNIQTDGFTEGDSLDVIMDLAETDSTEADQIKFKVGNDGGTYEKNGTVPWKNFPPTVINQQGDITTPEDQPAITSPMDSLFYDFNLADPGDLQFTVNNLPPGSNAVYNNGRMDIYTPENYNGTVPGVTITANDGQYQVDTDPFDITYTPVNDAPVIGSFNHLELDIGDSTYVNLHATDVDNALSELVFSASYDTQNLNVTIDNVAKQALIKALGSGNHNILWRVTDPPGLYDEATQNVNINYIAILNALLMAAVTDDILPGITVNLDGVPYISNAQGIVTLPFRTGQRHLSRRSGLERGYVGLATRHNLQPRGRRRPGRHPSAGKRS